MEDRKKSFLANIKKKTTDELSKTREYLSTKRKDSPSFQETYSWMINQIDEEKLTRLLNGE